MEALISSINGFMPYIVIVMAVIIVLLFIMIICLFKIIGRVEDKYRRLMKGTNSKNLEEMLLERIDSIDEVKEISKKASGLGTQRPD